MFTDECFFFFCPEGITPKSSLTGQNNTIYIYIYIYILGFMEHQLSLPSRIGDIFLPTLPLPLRLGQLDLRN